MASHISKFKLWEKTKSIQCYYIMHFFAHQYNVMAMSSTVLIYMLHTEVISTLPSATLAQRVLHYLSRVFSRLCVCVCLSVTVTTILPKRAIKCLAKQR